MKAAIYSPYLDTLGGGERYTASFARALMSSNYRVELEWPTEGIKKQLQDRFNIDLKNAFIVDSINRGDGYDVCFWVSDGSIPRLRARNNIIHFQFPFKNVEGKSLLNKMKMFRVKHVVVNSKFTKKFIDEEYGVKSVVLYPPVDVNKFKARKSENIILYVGRFSELTQVKGHAVLIEAYKKLVKQGFGDWKLVLAGGTEVGAKKYLKKLKKQAKNYPIVFEEHPRFNKLVELYGKAKIFWSAAGFGVDEVKDPLKVEHFGITPVEAMASGCVVFLYNAGGHREIVENKKDGFLWDSEDGLIKATKEVINDHKLSQMIARIAKVKANKFSYENFENKVKKLL